MTPRVFINDSSSLNTLFVELKRYIEASSKDVTVPKNAFGQAKEASDLGKFCHRDIIDFSSRLKNEINWKCVAEDPHSKLDILLTYSKSMSYFLEENHGDKGKKQHVFYRLFHKAFFALFKQIIDVTSTATSDNVTIPDCCNKLFTSSRHFRSYCQTQANIQAIEYYTNITRDQDKCFCEDNNNLLQNLHLLDKQLSGKLLTINMLTCLTLYIKLDGDNIINLLQDSQTCMMLNNLAIEISTLKEPLWPNLIAHHADDHVECMRDLQNCIWQKIKFAPSLTGTVLDQIALMSFFSRDLSSKVGNVSDKQNHSRRHKMMRFFCCTAHHSVIDEIKALKKQKRYQLPNLN